MQSFKIDGEADRGQWGDIALDSCVMEAFTSFDIGDEIEYVSDKTKSSLTLARNYYLSETGQMQPGHFTGPYSLFSITIGTGASALKVGDLCVHRDAAGQVWEGLRQVLSADQVEINTLRYFIRDDDVPGVIAEQNSTLTIEGKKLSLYWFTKPTAFKGSWPDQ